MNQLIHFKPPSYSFVPRDAAFEFQKSVFNTYFKLGFHSSGGVANYLADSIPDLLFRRDQSLYMSYLEDEEIDEGLIITDFYDEFEEDVMRLLDHHFICYELQIKSPFDERPPINNEPYPAVW